MNRPLFALAGVAALAAVAGALVSQYVFHMEPCPWCVLQRLIFLAIGALALLAAVLPVRLLRALLGVAIAALGLGGMAAALWQHFVAAKSASCNLTLADRIVSGLGLDAALPAVFEARASCSEAAANLLGVPYEFWSLALFAVLAGAALIAVRRT
ncbi:MAG TPA: disulfide bond formation protein B [Burkholderiaceae bacterium]|nr:disulfide bond formation protein B [Burkholderiaceae bacterium]